MTSITLKIPTVNLGAVLPKLERLAKKARRFGGADVGVTLGEAEIETRQKVDEEGYTRKQTVSWTPVTLNAGVIAVGPYDLLCKLETFEGGTLRLTVPGITTQVDARFGEDPQICEHCKTRRRRNDVFVVHNRETGEQIQVGRTCLQDFLGVDPAAILARWTFLREAENMEREERDNWGRGDIYREDTLQILTLACTIVRLRGWCSRAQAEAAELPATAGLIINVLHGTSKGCVELRREVKAAMNEGDETQAKAVKAWGAALGGEATYGLSEYETNLRVLCTADAIPANRVSFLASAVAAHAKAMGRELERTKRAELNLTSEHVGAKGEKIEFEATLEERRSISSNYGPSSVCKFRDAKGNLFVWITGTAEELRVGDAYKLKATVKDHKEFRGTKETHVLRAKWTAIKEKVQA